MKTVRTLAEPLFSSLYTDRGSHYFQTPKGGGKVAKEQPTQVGRALAPLGIDHIPSYSPEARRRMERVFGTLQQRLAARAAAGRDHLDRGGQPVPRRTLRARPQPPLCGRRRRAGHGFVPFAGNLAEILCLQEERQVGNNNCVRYRGITLQIPAQAHRHHFVKARVRVHAYADGPLALFHGPRCLARYRADGTCLDQNTNRPPSHCARRPRPVDLWTTQGAAAAPQHPRQRPVVHHLRVARGRRLAGRSGAVPLEREKEMDAEEYLVSETPEREPTHPGAILREDVLPALRLSVSAAARQLGVSRQTLHRILAGTHPVSAQTAVRLGKFCGHGPRPWLRMQAEHDLWKATAKLAEEIERIPVHAA